MPDRHVNLLYRLRQTLQATGAVPDADLLDRFTRGHDQAAFELLLWRHGPMVWGVCRRVLGHTQDAEDAFQAAFLALARRAATLRSGAALAGWLYRVAHHAALGARARRGACLGEVSADLPTHARGDDPARTAADRELAELLDNEVAGLPERFRLPFILCHLQGRSRAEAAAELRCPVGTVESRLHRARGLLRSRLARRGVALSGALLVARVPASLRAAVLQHAAVPASAAGLPAALLAERVLRSLALAAPTKWLAGVLAMCLLVTGLCLTKLRSDAPPAAPPSAPPSPLPQAAADREPLPAEAVARVGSPRLRHGDGITSIAFSPDGRWIASTGDGTARIWEAATGRMQFRTTMFRRAPLRLLRVAFTPDSKSVVVLDSDSCRTVDFRTGKELARHPHPQGDTASVADLAPDGSRFATAQPGKDVSVRDSRTGKEIFSLPVTGIWGTSVAFSADMRVLALPWSGDPKDWAFEVRLFDAATGKARGNVKDSKRHLAAPALSPDGKTVAALSSSASSDDALVLWDVAGGGVVRRITGLEPTSSCIAFSPDGKLLAVGNVQRLWLQVFEVSTGKELRRLRCSPSVTTVAFSPDGKTLAAGKSEGNITLWNVTTGKTHPASSDPDGAFFHLRFSDDARSLLTVAGDVTLRDWRTGRVLHSYPDPRTVTPLGLSISHDNKRMATCDPDGEVRLVDAQTGKDLHTLKGHLAADQTLFAPDGRRLFTMGYDNTVRVWDVATGKQVHCLDTRKVNSFCKLAVSPDGKVLAALFPTGQGPSEVRLWDTQRGTELHRLAAPDMDGRAVAFSPDGVCIACAGQDPENGRLGDIVPGHVIVWDVTSGRQLRSFAGHSGAIYDVAFSPDGRMLATAGHDHTVRLWEASSGKERHHFRGHESPVYRLAFSPDGRFLAAASAEAPVYVWDVIGTTARPAPLSRAEQARAWQGLADADGAAAFKVMRRLATAPDEAVTVLGKHLSPAPAADVERARRLLADLDADDFEVRQRATEELAKVAEQVEGLLRQARKEASVETSRRLDQILRKIDNPTAERLRQARAVEVLQWLATPAADRLLARLAGGTAGARLTTEAAAARECLRRRMP